MQSNRHRYWQTFGICLAILAPGVGSDGCWAEEDLPKIIARVPQASSQRTLLLSNDAKHLYTFGYDSVSIFAASENGYSQVAQHKLPSQSIDRETIRLSEDGETILAKSSLNIIAISLRKPLQPTIRVTKRFESSLTSNMCISGDCTHFASFQNRRGPINVVDYGTEEAREIEGIWPADLYDLHLSKKGGHLLAIQEGRVTLFDSVTGEPIQMLENLKIKRKSRFTSDGSCVLIEEGYSPRQITILDLESGEQQSVVLATSSDEYWLTADRKWLLELKESNVFFHRIGTEDYFPIKLSESYYNLDNICESGNRIAFVYNRYPIVVIEYPKSAESN